MKETQKKLIEIAETQQGYFTTKQAIKAGYQRNHHPYHVKQGNWAKEQRGIYRLASFPDTDESEYVIWSLWSCNQKGEIQGVYSHETALVIHDVSDANPNKLHMSVPKNFRRNSLHPSHLILHQQCIPEKDVIHKHGYNVTSPLRSIIDLFHDEGFDETILRQAISDFLKRGLIPLYIIKNIEEAALKEIMNEIAYAK